MAHFPGQQLVALLGLLASGHVEEDAEHDAIHDLGVSALPPGGDPANRVAYHDPEVDLVRSSYRARSHECGSDPVAIGRMNMSGQLFEGDLIAPGQTPQLKA